MSALREGSISVNALWALILSGIASLEDFYRAMYFAAELRRKHGVQLRYANLTDVPSYTSALPSILVAAGIDSFVGISNHTRGGNADSDALHLCHLCDGVDLMALRCLPIFRSLQPTPACLC